MTEMVTMDDCRRAGFCVAGIRRHCRVLGLSFRELAGGGLPLAEVEHINDADVQRIIAVTRERIARDG